MYIYLIESNQDNYSLSIKNVFCALKKTTE